MPLKCGFLAKYPSYLGFSHENPNLSSILKQEVVLWLFLCTRSEKITKMPLRCGFLQNHSFFRFFALTSPNLRSILKPEVILWLFLCTRSEKITKMPFKMWFSCKIPALIYVFRYEKFELGLHFETGSSIVAASVHAQWKNHKNAFKMWFPLQKSPFL